MSMPTIDLPNTPRDEQPLRACDDCNTNQPPEGGVQLRPTRWVCVKCWDRIWRKRK